MPPFHQLFIGGMGDVFPFLTKERCPRFSKDYRFVERTDRSKGRDPWFVFGGSKVSEESPEHPGRAGGDPLVAGSYGGMIFGKEFLLEKVDPSGMMYINIGMHDQERGRLNLSQYVINTAEMGDGRVVGVRALHESDPRENFQVFH